MSINIRLAANARIINGNDEPIIDMDIDDVAPSAYVIHENGVLSVLVNRANTPDGWEISEEFGPGAWLRAQGTRYTGPTKDLYGHKGKFQWKSTVADFPVLPEIEVDLT